MGIVRVIFPIYICTSSMRKKIKVHIADDHKILIEGVVAVINTDEEVEVEGFSLTGEDVLKWAKKKNTADILILDINMPVYDGVTVLRKLKEKESKLKVIVLSSYDDISFVQNILKLGAKGFVNKSSAGEHILKAIKAVYRGEKYFSDGIKDDLLKVFTGQEVDEGEKPETAAILDLTRREIDVLKLIVKEYSTADISKILKLSTNTVETYRKNLLKKTKSKNAVGLAVFAVSNNII